MKRKRTLLRAVFFLEWRVIKGIYGRKLTYLDW